MTGALISGCAEPDFHPDNMLNEHSIAERSSAPGNEKTLSDHLIRLPGSKWAFWKWVALRGSGFPAAEVLKLSVAESVALGDQLLADQESTEQAWEKALSALRRQIVEADAEKRAELHKALRQLKKGKVPEIEGVEHETQMAITAFSQLFEQTGHSGRVYTEAFEADLKVLSKAIEAVVSANDFREAAIWQNRNALNTGLNKLLKKGSATSYTRNKDTRRYEARAANYWQRYCVKNDTIGFFGPVGWARFVTQGEAINARPGLSLLAERSVYLEGWCIDALAEAVAQDESIRLWVAPRRLPFMHIEGLKVYRPLEGPLDLSPEEAVALEACDGKRSARDIARELLARPSFSMKDEREVYRLLDQLDSQEVIAWRFEVPWNLRVPAEWHIEANFTRQLENVADESIGGRALEILDELLAARHTVVCATGDAEKLNRAMQEMESTFTRLTEMAATRRHGKMYAGRTLVYEDCRRDIEVEIGPTILGELGPPLSLLLTSAQWFISEVAVAYLGAFKRLYSEIAQSVSTPAIDFLTFWLRAQPLVFGQEHCPHDNILSGLQQRWSEILAIPDSLRRVNYRSADLKPDVEAAFKAARAGWQYGRYHSPDLMIAAPSVEAICRGEYELVLGEFHVGTNSLCNKLFVSQHPFPEAILAALDRDMSKPRIVPVPDKQVHTSRDHTLLVSAKDFRLEYSRDLSGIPSDVALPIGSLLAEETPEGLIVRTRDGRLKFDLIEVFADLLSERVANHFKILPPSDYAPRISFDRLIVSRETWRIAPAEMAFANEKDEALRFLEARNWARAYNLPRYVFVKSPLEEKPFYVDFNSPVLISLFARAIRQSAEAETKDRAAEERITITEMLPTPDQVWLPDAEGRLYTSELRMVAIDYR
jgi:hypothetical protein